MNCPNCNAVLSGTSKFCTKCGFKLAVNPQPQPAAAPVSLSVLPPFELCTVCGAPLNPRMKFCTKCGSAVGAKAPTLKRLKTGETVKIDGQQFVIGKKQEKVNYCILDNPAISRVHAAIVERDGQFYIIDAGSTNHTYVDGTQAPANLEVPINNGAKIRLANEEFVFEA